MTEPLRVSASEGDAYPYFFGNSSFHRYWSTMLQRLSPPAQAFSVFTIVMVSLQAATMAAAPDVSQPNIVVIMADDLGYGDVSCNGATAIKTPHIDALADGACGSPAATAPPPPAPPPATPC